MFNYLKHYNNSVYRHNVANTQERSNLFCISNIPSTMCSSQFVLWRKDDILKLSSHHGTILPAKLENDKTGGHSFLFFSMYFSSFIYDFLTAVLQF